MIFYFYLNQRLLGLGGGLRTVSLPTCATTARLLAIAAANGVVAPIETTPRRGQGLCARVVDHENKAHPGAVPPWEEASGQVARSESGQVAGQVARSELASVRAEGGGYWVERTDPATGRVFFYNLDSGESSLAVPRKVLHADWEVMKDPVSGRILFYNKVSFRSQWQALSLLLL